ncbi:hypothetical protein Rrhod_3777 [Rhodococcus rhodnii LMG 5362]|uniref:Uncharacterized protein n=1 Tax=Rhodococcus rhodnii LMG 5362 TaxID=1273125 RepID=R7WIA4_9NOCA|nr:hypothetical protein Rrhod_3777 [Rhodococcus rhodnii LMG 5362]
MSSGGCPSRAVRVPAGGRPRAPVAYDEDHTTGRGFGPMYLASCMA